VVGINVVIVGDGEGPRLGRDVVGFLVNLAVVVVIDPNIWSQVPNLAIIPSETPLSTRCTDVSVYKILFV